MLWGWTFVWMKQAVGAAETTLGPGGELAGIALFLTLRFALAAAVVLFVPAARAGLGRGAWLGGIVVGLALYAGFLLQMLGLGELSPAVSAFLTSLYVLFTAALTTLRSRRAPHAALIAGALLATFGAGFIGGPPQLTFGRGEWLTVGCALVFAVHILVTDAWTRREAPIAVTLTSFVVVALSSLATLAVAARSDAIDGPGLAELALAPGFLGPVVLSSLLATVLALTLMNVYQRELDPVRAAIVYAVEPVWAAAVGLAGGFEQPTGWLYVGGAALIAGNLVAEIVPAWLARRAARAA